VTERLHSLRELEHEVGILMRRVKRALAERAALVHPDLPPTSYVVLAWLLEEGPRRSSEIAEAFDLDKGAVSRQVHLLAGLGLVDRTPDPADGRASILTATDEARRRMDEIGVHRLERLDQRLAAWTDGDVADLVATLRRYNQTLER
jgi:DNA-binding MarR family transcriptional regulator